MQPRASLGLPNCSSFHRQLPAYLGFDAVQRGNSGNGLGGDRLTIRPIDIDEFTSDVRPTSRFLNVPCFIKSIEPGIGIGLQYTPEGF